MKLLSLFIAILFSFNSFSENCYFYFKYNSYKQYGDDILLAAKINRVEDSINFVRNILYKNTAIDSNIVKASHQAWSKKLSQIESQLFQGSAELGVISLRSTYAKVNRSVKLISEFQEVIALLESAMEKSKSAFLKELRRSQVSNEVKGAVEKIIENNPMKSILKKLHKRLRREYRVLGNNYEKYTYFQSRLEKLKKSVECQAICQKGLKALERELRKPIKAKKLTSFFNSHPESVMIARKLELLNESLAVLKKYLNKMNFYQRIREALLNHPRLRNSKLFKIIAGKLDDDAKTVHKEIIDKVVSSELDNGQKVAFLKKEVQRAEDENILVNFSRRKDYETESTWETLYKHAKENEPLYASKMEEARKIGNILGPIGSVRLRSRTLKVILAASLGGAAILYFLGDAKEVPLEGDGSNPEELNSEVINISYQASEADELETSLSEILSSIPQN